MKIYIAAPFSTKDLVCHYQAQLQELGFIVTSTWQHESHPPDIKHSEIAPKLLTEHALNDIRDLNEADTLIFFSRDPEHAVVRGGRHVEFGYALAQEKRIVVIGPFENVFHHLPWITHFPTWLDAVEYLIGVKNALHTSSTED